MENRNVLEVVRELQGQTLPQTRWVDAGDVKENPNNPQVFTDKDMAALKLSITDAPWMMMLRPVVVDKNLIAQGGNKRLRACRELGWPQIPVIDADALTEEQLREFIIKDNVNFGKWDIKKLKAEWDVAKLQRFGMNVKDMIKNNSIPGEIVFSTEADYESNYVVLKFDKDIDWLHIQSLLGLQSTYSIRQNGKPWAKGLGRVVDGLTAIKKIQDAALAEDREYLDDKGKEEDLER